MNDQEEQEIKELIIYSSEYYGQKISDHIMLMHYKLLCGYSYQELKKAYETFLLDPKNKFAPRPSDIVNLLSPQTTQEIEAREAVSRIIESLGKFGYMRGDEARPYIGELGWKIVTRYGGWGYLCENGGTGKLSIPMLISQMKELGVVVQERERIGISDQPPQIKKNETEQIDSRVKNLISGTKKEIE